MIPSWLRKKGFTKGQGIWYNLVGKLRNLRYSGAAMATIKISSDEARSKWREVIDTAVAGNHVIIERYGKPVVAVVAHPEYAQLFGQGDETVLREAAAVYQTAPWNLDMQALKAELVNKIKAELLADSKWRDNILQYELGQMRQDELTHLEEEFADYEQQYPKADV